MEKKSACKLDLLNLCVVVVFALWLDAMPLALGNSDNGAVNPMTSGCSPTSQGFDDITTLPAAGWVQTNHSTTIGTTGWFQGDGTVFPAQGGGTASYIGANFNNSTNADTISNWLLTPPLALQNGAVLTFYTRTVDVPVFADRLQVRMSTNGISSNVGALAADVGDFTTLLLDINPTYTLTGYPNVWTQFSVTVNGIVSQTTGRLALRYFVENGGPNGVNSDYIGIDTLQFSGHCGATPTPGPGTAPRIYVDDDQGRLGIVDVQTGVTTVIGAMGVILTDIAFAPNGDLFGLSDTGFYRINSQTASVTFIGNHGIPTGNALVFDSDGTLYAAGALSTSLYRINPTSGAAVALGNIGYNSAGDLAFKGGALYLSSTTNELVRISLSTYVGTPIGFIGFDSVFGLATGSNSVLYGISGTRIFSVNTGTGAGVLSTDYQGRGLSAANGSSFISEAVPSQLLNISTRVRVQTGENVLIGGSIITGSVPKRIIIRALGPSLTALGILGALPDPVLELHTSTGLVLINDDWKSDQRAEIEATGIPPINDNESAIVATLSPGNCTAIVRGFNGEAGVGLIEVYDLDPTANSKLGNISTRGVVQTGENVMIGGFIVGNGSAVQRVLARGIGPSLGSSGIQNPLQDPTLDLHDGNGTTIASNDNWKETQQAAIQATGIPPTDDRESAILAALPPGNYTAVLRGRNDTTGVALVEVYNVN